MPIRVNPYTRAAERAIAKKDIERLLATGREADLAIRSDSTTSLFARIEENDRVIARLQEEDRSHGRY
jgi:hypothetical protein